MSDLPVGLWEAMSMFQRVADSLTMPLYLPAIVPN